MNLSVDSMHLKDPLFLFGIQGSTLSLPLSLLCPGVDMLSHCPSTMTKDLFFEELNVEP